MALLHANVGLDGQYDVYSDHANILAGVTNDAAKRIADTGSLLVARGTHTVMRWHVNKNTAPNHFQHVYGYLSFRILQSLTTQTYVGYRVLASQTDCSGGTGTFYAAYMTFTSFNKYVSHLGYWTAGLQTPPSPAISTNTSIPNYTLGDIFTMTVQVVNDPVLFGGVVVQYWLTSGVAPVAMTDPPPPTLQYTWASAVVVPSFGEGEFGVQTQNNQPTEIVVDNVGRFATLVTP